MKIMLLSGGRRLTPDTIKEVASVLGSAGVDVEFSVASWLPPTRPLPVSQHLVIGPHVSMGRGTTMVATAPSRPIAQPSPQTLVVDPGVPEPAPQEIVAGDDAPDVSSMADQAAASSEERVADERPNAGPMSKRLTWGPARVRAAVRWRWRRVRRHPVVRRARRALVPSSAIAFAINSRHQLSLLEAARDADLVVALDSPAYPAAWVIAQRVRGPAVVAGAVAARRLLVQGVEVRES